MLQPGRLALSAKSKIVEQIPLACTVEAVAVEFLEAQRWGETPACVHCGSTMVYKMQSVTGGRNKRYLWRCRDCRRQYTVRVGTVFEESRIELRHWCYAFWRASTSKKGVAALEIMRQCQISYKSALFLLHRVRFALAPDHATAPKLSGTVECDETYVGGKPRDMTRTEKIALRQHPQRELGIRRQHGKTRTRSTWWERRSRLLRRKNMGIRLATHLIPDLVWGGPDSPSGSANPICAWGSNPYCLPLPTTMQTLLDECPPARLDCAPALDDQGAGVWHLLFTKGQREKRLARDLYRLGLDFFFPMSERVQRDAYRHRNVSIIPLFPNYLFLRGGADDIGIALGTHHIIKVLPVVNQNKLRRDLLNMETAIRLDPRIERAVEYVKGQKVRVAEGPYEGLVGEVIKRGKDTLLQIEVESCGRAVMEIDASRVEPL